jgi:hypothetical protein
MTTLNAAWLANKNPTASQSYFQHTSDYVNSNNGYSPALRILSDIARLGNELGNFSPRLESDLGAAASVLPILVLPVTTDAAIKSFADLTQENGVALPRKVMNAIKNSTDCLSAYAWTATLFTNHSAVKTTAEMLDLTHNAVVLQTSASDYSKASALESAATGELKEAIGHSKKYYLLAIAKSVTAVAIGVIGLIALITGFQLVSVVALIVLTLTATVFEAMRDIKRESSLYPIIDFDRDIRLA